MGNTHYLFCPTRVGSLMQSRFWGSLQSMGTEKISIKIIFHRLELRSVYKDVKFSHTGLIENSLFSNVCDAFRTGRGKIREVGGDDCETAGETSNARKVSPPWRNLSLNVSLCTSYVLECGGGCGWLVSPRDLPSLADGDIAQLGKICDFYEKSERKRERERRYIYMFK